MHGHMNLNRRLQDEIWARIKDQFTPEEEAALEEMAKILERRLACGCATEEPQK